MDIFSPNAFSTRVTSVGEIVNVFSEMEGHCASCFSCHCEAVAGTNSNLQHVLFLLLLGFGLVRNNNNVIEQRKHEPLERNQTQLHGNEFFARHGTSSRAILHRKAKQIFTLTHHKNTNNTVQDVAKLQNTIFSFQDDNFTNQACDWLCEVIFNKRKRYLPQNVIDFKCGIK